MKKLTSVIFTLIRVESINVRSNHFCAAIASSSDLNPTNPNRLDVPSGFDDTFTSVRVPPGPPFCSKCSRNLAGVTYVGRFLIINRDIAWNNGLGVEETKTRNNEVLTWRIFTRENKQRFIWKYNFKPRSDIAASLETSLPMWISIIYHDLKSEIRILRRKKSQGNSKGSIYRMKISRYYKFLCTFQLTDGRRWVPRPPGRERRDNTKKLPRCSSVREFLLALYI